LIRHDEKRAITAAEEFWGTAVKQLEKIEYNNSWRSLQALQLLTHYALLNPKSVNCTKCASAATRLCLQLGLHLELPLRDQKNLNETLLNTRRRLFWTSYSLDAYVRPGLPNQHQTDKLVEHYTLSSASHSFGQAQPLPLK
jgi:hypothetical protein